jgi:hypothetical protein
LDTISESGITGDGGGDIRAASVRRRSIATNLAPFDHSITSSARASSVGG